jgi:hypothetical protein
MKKFLFSALALATLSVGLSRASAQIFAGFDDFSTLSGNPPSLDGKWAYFFRTNGNATNNGDLAFTGTQLDFSKGAGAGSYFLGWLGAPPSASRSIDSYTTSWVSEISVTSNFASLAVGSDFLAVGIEVAGGAGQFSAIMLNTNTAGNFIRTEGSGATVNQVSSPSSTDVRLRLSWDATTKLLVSSFSTDNGSSYTDLTTFTPDTQWTGSTQGANGFNFEIWVNSNAAVPEPSTYALLASGLGLVGLAVWRKRR